MTTAEERPSSRSLTEGLTSQAELKYLICDAATEADAIAQIRITAPATYTTSSGVVLQLTSVNVDPTDQLTTWEGRATYTRVQPRDSFEYSFDIGSTNAHLTQSIATVSKTPCNGGAIVDNFGAIGVSNHQGSVSVAGVDVSVPTYHWQEGYRFAGNRITQAYKLLLFGLCGKTNDAAFEGFEIGEVLFLGAAGKMRDDGDWDITFRFAASPNTADACAEWPITVRPAAVPKKGWDYLWVRYKDDTNANDMTKKAWCVYVEKVYHAGSYANLIPPA
jgi:hypothetical protein